MRLKKGIPVIDQGDRLGFWGGKFGGNFVPETLKKPIEDLEIQFNKLKNDKNFIKERDKYFKNWIGTPTRFIKLNNLTILNLNDCDIKNEKQLNIIKNLCGPIDLLMVQFSYAIGKSNRENKNEREKWSSDILKKLSKTLRIR